MADGAAHAVGDGAAHAVPGAAAAAIAVREQLRALADPERASGAQAYMKSAMPYWGVRVPDVRRIARTAGRGLALDAGLAAAVELWDGATRREERYAALALLGLPSVAGRLEAVPFIERFTVEGAWWDFTDEIAHRVADLHDAHPAEARVLVLDWAVGADLWLRRLAIISQLRRRERLDLDLLDAVIVPNLADREFFIRKAIGWALRDAAVDHPAWVRAFVASHALSPLSRREALKHLA